MTCEDFSNEFDELYNNVTSNMAPGLDDYDKSVFLTQAQEEIVTQLYNGTSGFESSELNRRYLANLITHVTIGSSSPTSYSNYLVYTFTPSSGITPSNNKDILAIISEQVVLSDIDCYSNGKFVSVVPTKYDELNTVIQNPFRRPNNKRVLRVDKNTKDVLIISKYPVEEYICEYLKRPEPIIINTLPDELKIDSIGTKQTCALDESLHRTILKFAVQLAAASWASNNKN